LAGWNSTTSTWDCVRNRNTTYRPNIGLDLAITNVFSAESGYRLPQGDSAASLFRRVNQAGPCADLPAAVIANWRVERGRPAGEGIPDDGAPHSMAAPASAASGDLSCHRGGGYVLRS